MVISLKVGGDSIGVLPSQSGFIVTSHGHQTEVSEGLWLFSLIYPALSLLAFYSIGLLVAVKPKLLGKVPDKHRWKIRLATFCWWLLATVSLINNVVKSLTDWLSLKG